MRKSMISGKTALTAANLKTPNPVAYWEAITGTVYMKAPLIPTFGDPVQGACNSCYLIAALSSIAWVPTTQSKIAKTLAGVKFFNTSTRAWSNVSVTNQLPTDSNHALIYARGGDSGETWAAIYEKAYAKWKGCCGSGEDHPNYSSLPWGNPIVAIQEVIGYTGATIKDASAYAAEIPTDATGKTIYPSAAWTKATVNETGLYANHSYSLLGKYGDYVVLRNPYGATIANSEPTANIATGTWNNISLTQIDGIFAYSTAQFKANFAKYGWVTP